jgi:hypothetical protein
MNVETYFRRKGPAPGLTKAEALVLGISFPLQAGWLKKYGECAITAEQEQMLAQLRRNRRGGIKAASTTIPINQLDLFDGVPDER